MIMKRIYCLLILFVIAFIDAIYAEGSLLSTKGTLNSINSSNIFYIRVGIISAVVICFALYFIYISYAKHKELSIGFLKFVLYIYSIAAFFPINLSDSSYAVNFAISQFIIIFFLIKSVGNKPFIELTVIFAIITILANTNVPAFRNYGWSSRQKTCYSNMRIIQSAVEVYNADNTVKMRKLNLPLLDEKGYLKRKHDIKCPESNKDNYKAFGNLLKDGEIGCGDEPIGGTLSNQKKYHGTISGYGTVLNP